MITIITGCANVVNQLHIASAVSSYLDPVRLQLEHQNINDGDGKFYDEDGDVYDDDNDHDNDDDDDDDDVDEMKWEDLGQREVFWCLLPAVSRASSMHKENLTIMMMTGMIIVIITIVIATMMIMIAGYC